MAQEVRLTTQLAIRKTSGTLVLIDKRYQRTIVDDMAGTLGPVPGAMLVPTTGKLVYFTGLDRPGYVWIENQDTTNFVEVGIYDPTSGRAFPSLEIPPGQGFPLLLTRNFGEEYTGSGTGTTTPENYLWIKANGAACPVSVEAYER